MKKKTYISKSGSMGLKGGPNEIGYSMTGYKETSMHNNRFMNVIPGANISMRGVNHNVFALANNGMQAVMRPGGEYNFPGADYVMEFKNQNDMFNFNRLGRYQVAGGVNYASNEDEGWEAYTPSSTPTTPVPSDDSPWVGGDAAYAAYEQAQGQKDQLRQQYMDAQKAYEAEKYRTQVELPKTLLQHLTEKDKYDTPTKTNLAWIKKGKHFCSSHTCEALENSGYTVPQAGVKDKDGNWKYEPGASFPLIPGNAAFQSMAPKLGFVPITEDQMQPGDVVQMVDFMHKDYQGNIVNRDFPHHSMIVANPETREYYNAPGGLRNKYDITKYPDVTGKRFQGWHYVGDMPALEQKMQAAEEAYRNAPSGMMPKIKGRPIAPIPTTQAKLAMPDRVKMLEDEIAYINNSKMSKKKKKEFIEDAKTRYAETTPAPNPPTYKEVIEMMPDGTMAHGGQPCYECGGAHYNEGGYVPEGYHMMPDGTIMANAAHMMNGGNIDFSKLGKRAATDYIKNFGGTTDVNAPQNMTTDGMVDYKKNMFKNKISRNVFSNLADSTMHEAAQQAQNMFYNGGQNYSPTGGSYRTNAADLYAKDWAAKQKGYGQTWKNIGQNFASMTQDFIDNPAHMEYDQKIKYTKAGRQRRRDMRKNPEQVIFNDPTVNTEVFNTAAYGGQYYPMGGQFADPYMDYQYPYGGAYNLPMHQTTGPVGEYSIYDNPQASADSLKTARNLDNMYLASDDPGVWDLYKTSFGYDYPRGGNPLLKNARNQYLDKMSPELRDYYWDNRKKKYSNAFDNYLFGAPAEQVSINMMPLAAKAFGKKAGAAVGMGAGKLSQKGFGGVYGEMAGFRDGGAYYPYGGAPEMAMMDPYYEMAYGGYIPLPKHQYGPGEKPDPVMEMYGSNGEKFYMQGKNFYDETGKQLNTTNPTTNTTPPKEEVNTGINKGTGTTVQNQSSTTQSPSSSGNKNSAVKTLSGDPLMGELTAKPEDETTAATEGADKTTTTTATTEGTEGTDATTTTEGTDAVTTDQKNQQQYAYGYTGGPRGIFYDARGVKPLEDMEKSRDGLFGKRYKRKTKFGVYDMPGQGGYGQMQQNPNAPVDPNTPAGQTYDPNTPDTWVTDAQGNKVLMSENEINAFQDRGSYAGSSMKDLKQQQKEERKELRGVNKEARKGWRQFWGDEIKGQKKSAKQAFMDAYKGRPQDGETYEEPIQDENFQEVDDEMNRSFTDSETPVTQDASTTYQQPKEIEFMDFDDAGNLIPTGKMIPNPDYVAPPEPTEEPYQISEAEQYMLDRQDPGMQGDAPKGSYELYNQRYGGNLPKHQVKGVVGTPSIDPATYKSANMMQQVQDLNYKQKYMELLQEKAMEQMNAARNNQASTQMMGTGMIKRAYGGPYGYPHADANKLMSFYNGGSNPMDPMNPMQPNSTGPLAYITNIERMVGPGTAKGKGQAGMLGMQLGAMALNQLRDTSAEDTLDLQESGNAFASVGAGNRGNLGSVNQGYQMGTPGTQFTGYNIGQIGSRQQVRYGGMPDYREGDTVYLNEREIEEILMNGGSIEYID